MIEHQGVHGTAFAVWAPSARSVSIVGDFNSWDGRLHPMRSLGSSGIWELFLPGVGDGANYKYEILTQSGEIRLKADPLAFATELPPKTASVIHDPSTRGRDADWLERARAETAQLDQPISIYEVHLGSWRLNPQRGQPLAHLPRARRRARRRTRRTWASPTSSCCRSWRTRSAAPGATR